LYGANANSSLLPTAEGARREQHVYGNSADAAQRALINAKASAAQDWTNQRVRKGSITEEIERAVKRIKSRGRARAEHVFGVVKRLWGFRKGALNRLSPCFHARRLLQASMS